MCQGICHFSVLLHHLALAKFIATSRLRVNQSRTAEDFHCLGRNRNEQDISKSNHLLSIVLEWADIRKQPNPSKSCIGLTELEGRGS